MFDKELFNKICTVTCSFEELANFVTNIDEKEFDLDDAFEKYYSLERILCAIKKYKSKQISDKFLAYWANAYDWILMSGFKVSYYKEKNNRYIALNLINQNDKLEFYSIFLIQI